MVFRSHCYPLKNRLPTWILHFHPASCLVDCHAGDFAFLFHALLVTFSLVEKLANRAWSPSRLKFHSCRWHCKLEAKDTLCWNYITYWTSRTRFIRCSELGSVLIVLTPASAPDTNPICVPIRKPPPASAKEAQGEKRLRTPWRMLLRRWLQKRCPYTHINLTYLRKLLLQHLRILQRWLLYVC